MGEAAENEMTLEGHGAKITLSATGVLVQISDPSRVTIVGPNGKPFAAVAANSNAPVFDWNNHIGVVIDLFDNGQPVTVLGMDKNKAYVGVPATMIQVMNHRQSIEYVQKLNYAGQSGWENPPEGLTKTMYDQRLILLKYTKGKLPDSDNCLWSGAPHDFTTAWTRYFDNGTHFKLYRYRELSAWPARSLTAPQTVELQKRLLARERS